MICSYIIISYHVGKYGQIQQLVKSFSINRLCNIRRNDTIFYLLKVSQSQFIKQFPCQNFVPCSRSNSYVEVYNYYIYIFAKFTL